MRRASDLVPDTVADRLRSGGLDELLQFDWALVGETDELAGLLADAADLPAVDHDAVQQRLRQIRGVIADRRRYIEGIA